MNYDALNTATHTLEALILIIEILKEIAVEMIYDAAEKYTRKSNSILFKEFINLINDNNIDIKTNTLTLIYELLSNAKDSSTVKKI